MLFYANGSKEKNGTVPIMGRVTINGTVAQFSCKRSISKELWDAKGNRAKGKSLEARETNLALDNIKAQIIKHYQRISDREAFVTAEMVRNAYQGIGGDYETLLKAFDRENEVFKKRVGKDRKLATYQSRVVARNYVAAFIKSFYKRSDMSMLELHRPFFRGHQGTDQRPNRGGERREMDYLQASQDGRTFPSKAAGHPLADNRALPTVPRKRLGIPQSELYWSICKPLKKMIRECGVNKDISFHLRRHGFATLALCKGMPIESVSRILGHTNIETTQIYAKITVEKLDNDLTMLGDKLSKSFGNIKVAGI